MEQFAERFQGTVAEQDFVPIVHHPSHRGESRDVHRNALHLAFGQMAGAAADAREDH